MGKRFGFLAFLLLSVRSLPAQTGQWHRYSSPGMYLVTSAEPSDARAFCDEVQMISGLFARSGLRPVGKAEPAIHVVAFRSKPEYEAFQVHPGTLGHYIHSRRGDYIAVQSLTEQGRVAGLHEYSHAALRLAGLRLPIWLNEGLADIYSWLMPDGEGVVLGAPIPFRKIDLSQPFLPLPELLAVANESAIYGDPRRVRLFYGESWALTHMLMFGPEYRSRFLPFVRSVSSGIPAEQALRQMYGKDLDSVTADLKAYYQSGQLQTWRTDLEPAPAPKPVIEPLTTTQRALELADLLLASKITAPRAETLLAGLLSEDPENVEARDRLQEALQNENR